MTTFLPPLAELAAKTLTKVSISADGDWMIFTTDTNEEIKLNCASVVAVTEDYWARYIAAEAKHVSYALQST